MMQTDEYVTLYGGSIFTGVAVNELGFSVVSGPPGSVLVTLAACTAWVVVFHAVRWTITGRFL